MKNLKIKAGKLVPKVRDNKVKKKVFEMFVKTEGLYLTTYGLRLTLKLINKNADKLLSTKAILKELPVLHNYTNPDKGAFSTNTKRAEWLAKVRKTIVRINPRTKQVKVFESICEAAKSIPNKPYAYTHIVSSLDKPNSAYGYIWKSIEAPVQ